MKAFFTFFLCAFWLIGQLGAQSSPNLAVIHPDLLEEMETDESKLIPVYIILEDRVDVASMERDFQKRNLNRQERVPELLHALQEKASNTQGFYLDKLRSMPGVNKESIRGYWITNLIYAQMQPEAIKALSSTPGIELIEIIKTPTISKLTKTEATAAPDGREVGLSAINAPTMWDLGYTGYGRKVLIMDTGVDGLHPALQRTYYGNIVPSHLAWFDQWGSSTTPTDCDSHGTHVCGTTVGLDPSTKDTVGVAFNSFWMGSPEIPGFSPDCISQFDPAGVFQWSLNPDGDINTTEDMPDVINNSWRNIITGVPGNFCNPGSFGLLQITVEAAGIIAVFGAGNEGPSQLTMGAEPSLNMSLVNTFAVGSIDPTSPNFDISGFSSRGPSHCPDTATSLFIKPEVVAPGSFIRSTTPNNSYSFFSGTSMATPHVSGAFLLLREAFPTLPAYDLKMALYLSAIDLGPVGEDNIYGNGLIDIKAAYDYLINQGNTPIIPDQSNNLAVGEVINIEAINCTQNIAPFLTVENRGTGDITSAEIELAYSDGFKDTLEWTGLLFPAAIQPILLPQRQFASGGYSLEINVLKVNQGDDYFYFDNNTEVTFQVLAETINVEPIAEVCPGSNTILAATPSSGEINWYDAPTGGTLLGTGNSFETNNLNANTDFYAIIEQSGQAGKDTYVGDNGFVDQAAGEGLFFNAFSSFTLKSVTVFCQGDGQRRIELRNSAGIVLQSKDLQIGLGPRVLELDFEVPAENNLQLVAEGVGNLFISTDNISYPYITSGMMEVTGSTLDQGVNTFYPYFYDWKISTASMCDRIPITVQVGNGSLTADFNSSTNAITLPWNGTVSFSDQSTGAVSWLWDFGDGNTSTDQNPSHTYTLVDTYQVVLQATNADGCTDVSTQTIEARGFNTSIDNLEQGYPINVFPNPNNGTLFISIDHGAIEKGILSIVNVQGQLVYQKTHSLPSQGRLELSLPHLAEGMYQINWQTQQKTYSAKFIKLD
ncbi:MAG: S8 family serine peptidase [Bacteroidota bacterium]